MAFITADQTRDIKRRLKAKFPEMKFSVRNSDHTSVNVSILSAPVDFMVGATDWDLKSGSRSINHYHLEFYGENADLLQEIVDVINVGNWDKSDIQTDYFNVGFYMNLEIGSWNKPFILTESAHAV